METVAAPVQYRFLKFHLWFAPGDSVPTTWTAGQIGTLLERRAIELIPVAQPSRLPTLQDILKWGDKLPNKSVKRQDVKSKS